MSLGKQSQYNSSDNTYWHNKPYFVAKYIKRIVRVT